MRICAIAENASSLLRHRHRFRHISYATHHPPHTLSRQAQATTGHQQWTTLRSRCSLRTAPITKWVWVGFGKCWLLPPSRTHWTQVIFPVESAVCHRVSSLLSDPVRTNIFIHYFLSPFYPYYGRCTPLDGNRLQLGVYYIFKQSMEKNSFNHSSRHFCNSLMFLKMGREYFFYIHLITIS